MSHTDHNKSCPWNDPETSCNPIYSGMDCTCGEDGFRNPNDVGNLEGKDLLNAMTKAKREQHYKGWSFADMLHGASVLPTAVHDGDGNIIKHESIVMTQFDAGQIVKITLMTTTGKGSFYQDFIPAGPKSSSP